MKNTAANQLIKDFVKCLNDSRLVIANVRNIQREQSISFVVLFNPAGSTFNHVTGVSLAADYSDFFPELIKVLKLHPTRNSGPLFKFRVNTLKSCDGQRSQNPYMLAVTHSSNLEFFNSKALQCSRALAEVLEKDIQKGADYINLISTNSDAYMSYSEYAIQYIFSLNLELDE